MKNLSLYIIISFFFFVFLLVSLGMGWFNKYLIMTGVALTFFIFILLVIVQVVAVFNMVHTKKEAPVYKTMKFFNDINAELSSMPGGDRIDWDEGKSTRTFNKSFLIAGKVNEFFAVVGRTLYNKKWITVIYNTSKERIEEYLGDPPPSKLINPFEDFSPIQTRYYQFDPEKNKNKKSNLVNIYTGKKDFENENSEESLERLSQQAREAMHENG